MPFLSQGSYGCVFYPHLKCNNNIKIDNAVGKIFKINNDAIEEKKLIQYINDIDPHSKWTIPYHGSCYTNINNANSSDNISRCKHNIKGNKEQLLFQHSGVDLTNIDFNNNILLDDLIFMLPPLLKGLMSLNQKKLIHCDIKPANILFDINLKKLYIIDFGLLTSYNDIVKRNKDYVLSFNYPYFPPEFKIYSNMILHNKPITKQKILSNFETYKLTYYKNFISKFFDIDKDINNFIKKSYSDKILFENKFKTEFISKIDIYSLGISFIEIFYKLTQKNTLQIRNKPLFDEFIDKIIIPMIKIDPQFRSDPKTSYDNLLLLLNKHNINTSIYDDKITEKKFDIDKPKSPERNCSQVKKTVLKNLLKEQNKPFYGNKETLCNRFNNDFEKYNKLTKENCEKLKGKEIKDLLHKNNKPTYGTKKQMCERLLNK